MESKLEIENNMCIDWWRIFANLKRFSVFDYAALLLLLAAMVLRVYKMHKAGIIFDEVWTYEEFATNIKQAVTTYNTTNNHLLNSVFIVIAKKIFGGYEHFLRIPSTIFGLFFCFSIFKILKKAISSKLIVLASLSFILYQWFIFDLSFLARGYAVGLGCVFGAVYFVVRFASESSGTEDNSWKYIISLIIFNFLSMAAMLSVINVLFAINVCFVVILCLKSAGGKPVKLVLKIGTLVVGSLFLILLFYSSVLDKVTHQAKIFAEVNNVNEQFIPYLNKVLWFPIIFNSSFIEFSGIVYKIIVMVSTVSVVVVSIRYLIKYKIKIIRRMFFSSRAILIIICAITFLTMFFQQQVMGISLGMPRNGVFFLVTVLLAFTAILDLASVSLFSHKTLQVCISGIISILIITLLFLNFVSAQVVYVHPWGWAYQSSVGPLLRDLKQIDSSKKWKIKLTSQTEACWRPVRYYNSYGYKAEIVKDNNYDVYILPIIKPDPRMSFLNYEKYIVHHVLILANERSFKNVSLQRLSSK